MKIRKGDLVQVITGKYKGKQGKVLAVQRDRNRVVVSKVNVVKKHKKSTGKEKDAGGIVEMEAPIDASNVMIIDPKNNKPTRVGYKIIKGNKVRVAKKSGVVLDKDNSK